MEMENATPLTHPSALIRKLYFQMLTTYNPLSKMARKIKLHNDQLHIEKRVRFIFPSLICFRHQERWLSVLGTPSSACCRSTCSTRRSSSSSGSGCS